MYRKQFFSYFSYSVIVILSWLYVCIFWKIFFFVLSLWWYCLNTLQLPEVLCFGLSDECTHWLSITMSDTPFCLSSIAHLIYSRRGLKPSYRGDVGFYCSLLLIQELVVNTEASCENVNDTTVTKVLDLKNKKNLLLL